MLAAVQQPYPHFLRPYELREDHRAHPFPSRRSHSFAFIARRFNEARSSPDETERPWQPDDVAEVCRTLNVTTNGVTA